MEQKAFLAIAGMLNSFPQGAANPDLTLQTYRAALDDVSSQAITETAVRYTKGEVPGQSKTFAPSIAEFCTEAKRWASLIPYRNRPALSAPHSYREQHRPDDRATRIRMGFKMQVLSAAIALKAVDRVAEANKRGLEDMIALCQEWGVPVPEELFQQARAA